MKSWLIAHFFLILEILLLLVLLLVAWRLSQSAQLLGLLSGEQKD